MRVEFTKMHGLGNDFIVLDGRARTLPPIGRAMARRLADRREGIGCDQLIVLEASDRAHCAMRIRNADGGEADACGNAARAVAVLIGRPVRVETEGGIIALDPGGDGARVDMGAPRFGWEDIPLAYAMDTAAMPVGWGPLEQPLAVNVGNPHVVFFVRDPDAVPLETLGPTIETDPLFPAGINVNVAAVAGEATVMLRVWERGAGLTRACGTGACATAVAAIRRGLARSPVTVQLPGGTLEIAWEGGTIGMSGPARRSFDGAFKWGDYA